MNDNNKEVQMNDKKRKESSSLDLKQALVRASKAIKDQTELIERYKLIVETSTKQLATLSGLLKKIISHTACNTVEGEIVEFADVRFMKYEGKLVEIDEKGIPKGLPSKFQSGGEV